MQKKLVEVVKSIKTINPIPRNYNIMKAMIDVYFRDCNWETMTQSDFKEWNHGLGEIMKCFWKLRGR
jgi:hypothetical protein